VPPRKKGKIKFERINGEFATRKRDTEERT
jgi:hypothetical protein